MLNEHHSTWPETTAGSPLSVEHLLKVSSEKTVRIAALERSVRLWEKWYAETTADFAGVVTPNGTLHDWEWMDDWRPAPSKMADLPKS